MKRTFSLIGVLAMLLWVVSCSSEKSGELTSPTAPERTASQLASGSAQSYTDYQGAGAPGISRAAVQQKLTVEVQGDLRFYATESSFGLVCDMTRVDFEGSNVPPNFVRSCPEAFNSGTNNECYSPGAIPDGISLNAFLPKEMVVLTRGFLGMPSTVVGPNFFSANLTMRFEPGEVNAVGMQLYNPFGPATLLIVVVGPNDVVLGVVSAVTGTSIPTFFGVFAPTSTITRLNFFQTGGGGGELVDNVKFGFCEFSGI